MAGMEQLQIHSKSYLVRWLEVPAGHSLSWSIQPHKKSLNFGIFRHPGGSGSSGAIPNLPSSENVETPATPGVEAAKGKGRSDETKVVEKLQAMGYKSVAWTGRCEADKVTLGKYDVKEGEGGMYGLVIDNTFSKQVSKTATLVLMSHPTNATPKSGASLHFSQAFTGSTSSLARPSPSLAPMSESTDSLPQDTNRPKSSQKNAQEIGSNFFTGVLQKKRRKRNQGYARRFFSLDFTSSTLSYYRNNHSSALRGSIPLALAEIGVDEKRREISVDSGAEVWRLKANNKKDFEGWRNALMKSSNSAHLGNSSTVGASVQSFQTAPLADPQADREWGSVENLMGRVSGIRDAVRRLAQDTDPKYLPATTTGTARSPPSATSSPIDGADAQGDYFGQEAVDREKEKASFWKRKASSSGQSHSPSALFRRSVSAQMAAASPSSLVPPTNNGSLAVPKRKDEGNSSTPNDELHLNCMALLRDLDSVINEFSGLSGARKQRRAAPAPKLTSRDSIDSATSEEFFDAQGPDTPANRSGFLTIRRDSNEQDGHSDAASDAGSASSSENEGSYERKPREGQPSLFPEKAASLAPLPLDAVKRRTTIAPAKVAPPSLISFLRKNVGKDLSTIAMPVASNEPTSLLQRFSEQMEYTELLDSAVSADADSGERILYITAFAVSTFSNSRVKERALRKPFNPMLGETFELVREDKGFRFIAEKVSHRPVRMAAQADAKDWSFVQSPMPVQKFWGKSAELNTEGRAHVILHPTEEHYSWTIATSFLRNIIAGEKYVEPVGTMSVLCETSGMKATVTFKAGGMFAGRSEDVTVEAFDKSGKSLPMGLTGKWTSHLNLTKNKSDTGDALWSVGPLVDNAPRCYGFTAFAAGLNEITSIEEDHLPVTDSRLRPDQRAAEDGDLDRAEGLKAKLEERQRSRRKTMEEHGDKWTPRWFTKVEESGDEELWRLKSGKDGYWEEREKGEWTRVPDVFESRK